MAEATEPLEIGAMTPGTVYHYAIVATSTVKEIEDVTVVETIEENGVVISKKEVKKVKVKEEKSATTIGPEQVLETSPPILPAFGPALVSNIGQSTATIATTLEAKGEPTRWELQLGRTPGNLQLQKAGNSRSPTPEPIVVGLETAGARHDLPLQADRGRPRRHRRKPRIRIHDGPRAASSDAGCHTPDRGLPLQIPG